MSGNNTIENIYLMRAALYGEYDDNLGDQQVLAAADLIYPAVKEAGVMVTAPVTEKHLATATGLAQALVARRVEAGLYIDPHVSEILDRTRTLPNLDGIREALAALPRSLGRQAISNLVIVTSAYPVEALRDLQNDDDPYGIMDRIEPGGIVLAREGIL